MLDDLKFTIHADQKTAAAFGKIKSDLGRLKGELRGLGGELQRTDNIAISAADSLESVGRSTGRLGAMSPAAVNNLRNLSFQFNQIGQQGLATGNYMQALSIQIPDILAAFGSLPLVIAGGAAALGASLIPSLIGGAEAAQTFEDAMADLDSQLASSSEVIDLISDDFSGLRERLAGTREEIASLGQSIADVSLRQLRAEADDLTSSLTRMYDGNSLLNRSRREELRAAFPEIGSSVNDLAVSFERLGRADSLGDKLQAATDLRLLFLDLVGPVEQMTDRQFEMYSSMADTEEVLRATLRRAEETEDAFDNAASAAANINDPLIWVIDNIRTAANEAASLARGLLQAAQLRAMSTENRSDFLGSELTYSGRGSGVYEMGLGSSYSPPDLSDVYDEFKPSGSQGGSSGGREVDDMARSFERLRTQLDPAYKAMQDMADARESLNWALQSGKISEQEHIDLLARAKDEYMATGDALTDYAQQVGDFFGDFAVVILDNIDSLDDLKTAVSDFVRSAARDLLKLAISAGFQALMKLAFGGSGGSLFGDIIGGNGGRGGGGLLSFSGGGYTGGGPRSGGVDGLGGFPAILHPNETIVDHTKGGSGAAVQVVISSDIPEGTVQQNDGRVEIQLGKMIVQMIESGMLDRAHKSRYGLSPRGRGA
ncbi:MAG: hypothetical protein VX874_15905 [Pseudomonadota bacterium]|nr:hypothetical protein [Pseudomonadota bacterium]